jgi:RNA polymerase sigma factor (sigma-70 family)
MTEPSVIRRLSAAFGPHVDGPTDGELLARFAAARDQGAFELLVWRHSAMVFRTCLAVLRDHHAAEDAAQAVFLALARQAAAVGRRGTVAGWLCRVARRVATRAVRRWGRVEATADLGHLPAPVPTREAAVLDEFARVLHEELARLPDKYRAPLALCFLDGLSHVAAARRLGWPTGTVAGRVSEAKSRLRRRLARRGVGLPAAGLAGALAAGVGRAVGPPFVQLTARAAVAFAAGAGTFPGVRGPILSLAGEEVRSVVRTKVLWVAGALTAWGAVVFGGVRLGDPPRPGAGAVPAGVAGADGWPRAGELGRPPEPAPEPAPATRPEAGGDPTTVAAPAGPQATPPGPPAAVGVAPPAPPGAVAVAPAGAGGGPEIPYAFGRVLGPDGKPPTGAVVQSVYGGPDLGPVLTGSFATDGHFSVAVGRLAVRDGGAQVLPTIPVGVTALAPGLGFGWVDGGVIAAGKQPIVQLVEDRAVSGRVLGPDGKPVAGATVRVVEVRAYPGGPEALRTALTSKGTDRPAAVNWTGPLPGDVGKAATNRAGEFRMTGLGRNRIVRLRIEAPGTVPATVSVVTLEPGEARPPARDEADRPQFGPTFELRLAQK